MNNMLKWCALIVTLVAAMACSKNESATAACGAPKDTESCNACCTSNGATGYKFISGTCECLGGDSKGGGAKPPVAAGVTFAGTYKSNWGPTVFTQTGNTVNAKYPNGSMTCQAAGSALDCDWREGALAGRAKLAKQADGSIRGTWGNGASATAGGSWTFLP
jgi:hypothetical protein